LPNPIIQIFLRITNADEKESHKEESSTNKFVVNFNIYYLKIFNRFSSKKESTLTTFMGFKFVQMKTIN